MERPPDDDGAETTRPLEPGDGNAATLPGRDPGSTGGEVAPLDGPVRSGAEILPQLPGYRVEAVLGRGAMGVVLRAEDLGLRRPVALKMILAGAHASGEERARFQIEAQSVARVTHPNIVQIFEVGEHDGRPYLALELAGGGTLASRMEGKSRVPREAARDLEVLARAVHAAHEKGVIHRDLKPANILLADDGTLKISDFGLAKRLDENDGRTRSGVIMGTPNYMSPEQAGGHGGAIGPGTDIYSLGAILYEMLTGEVPLRAPTQMETLHLVRNRDPDPPSKRRSGIPADLETLCLKCLEKDPMARYATAEDLADELRRFLDGEPIRARPVSPVERAVRWARRNPVVAALTASLLLSIVIGVTFGMVQLTRARDEAIRARNEALERARVERESRVQVEEQRKLAVAGERRARERLAASRALAGQQHARAGDATAAAVYFAEAHDADPAPLHRVNTHQMLARTARLAHVLEAGGPASSTALAPHVGRVAIAPAGGEGRVLVCGIDGGGSVPLTAPVSGVEGLVLSPDGRRLVTVAGGPSVLWDAATGREVATLGTFRPEKVSFTADSQRVVIFEEVRDFGSLEGYVEPVGSIHRADTGEREEARLRPRSIPDQVVHDPGGRRMALLNLAGYVELWDMEALRPVGPQVIDDMSIIGSLAFSADGRTLVGAARTSPRSGSGSLRFWDADTGLPSREPLEVDGELTCLALSSDGRTAVTGSKDGTVRVRDLTTGAPVGAPMVHGSHIAGIALSPDGATVATTSFDRCVRLWSALTGAAQGTVLHHEGPVTGLAFGPDEVLTITAAGAPVRTWSLPRPRVPRTIPSLIGTVPALDGTRLVVPTDRSTLEIRAVADGALSGSRLRHEAAIEDFRVSPDGSRVATASEDGTVALWRVTDGTRLLTLRHDAPVQEVAFDPEGNVLATAAGPIARLWDLASGEPLSAPLVHEHAVESLDILGGGSHLMTQSVEGQKSHEISTATRCLWDVARAEVRLRAGESSAYARRWRRLAGDEILALDEDGVQCFRRTGKASSARLELRARIRHLEVRPDGTAFAVALDDGSLELRDVKSMGRLGGDLRHTSAVSTLRFDPAGRRLLIEYDDHAVRLLDAATGEPVGTMIPSDAESRDWQFSDDGRWLAARYVQQDPAAGSAPGTTLVRLWDASTAAAVGKEIRHGGDRLDLAFSPDGRWLATSGDDDTIRLWDVPSGEPVEGSFPGSSLLGIEWLGPTRLLASTGEGIMLWDLDLLADTGDVMSLTSFVRTHAGHVLDPRDEIVPAAISAP